MWQIDVWSISLCTTWQNSKPKTAEQNSSRSPECGQEQFEKPPTRIRDSLTSALTVDMDICRICHCEAEPDMPLISPCVCSGSLAFVHQGCLQRWIKSSDTKKCELCKYEFIMESKMKPINKVMMCFSHHFIPRCISFHSCSRSYYYIVHYCMEPPHMTVKACALQGLSCCSSFRTCPWFPPWLCQIWGSRVRKFTFLQNRQQFNGQKLKCKCTVWLFSVCLGLSAALLAT